MDLLVALTAGLTIGATLGYWWPRCRAYRHQVRATRIAVTDPRLRADAIAWHRRQLVRPFRLHLPRLHARSH